MGVKKALLTTSCTNAPETAALLLNIGAEDEVVVPSFTLVSVINAFVLRGARPVFAEIRPDTFNLDETKLESLITARTKAIVPVHYAGVACQMDTIFEIASRRGVAVVEDNAPRAVWKTPWSFVGYLRVPRDTDFSRDQERHLW
jgi:dTDP-4-amino-4,6-dideoxygalactose transaminase